MSVRVPINPDNIEWAIGRSGKDPEALLKSFPKVASWGVHELPTLKQLEKFANSTHTPVGDLLLPYPPEYHLPVRDFRTMGNHPIDNPSVDLLDVLAILQSMQEWYQDYAHRNEIDQPSLVGSVKPFSDIQSTANLLRNLLNFDVSTRRNLGDPDSVFRFLSNQIESLGILVAKNGIVGSNVHRTLDPEEFRGVALADRVAPLIFVNNRDSSSAKIFTLCHELVHIAIGESSISNIGIDGAEPENPELQNLERWCNKVTAEILVPIVDLSTHFRPELNAIDQILELKSRYKVSSLVLLIAARDATLIGWDTYHEASSLFRRSESGRGASDSQGGGTFPRNQISRLGKKFARALILDTLGGGTSYSSAFEFIGSSKKTSLIGIARELGLQ